MNDEVIAAVLDRAREDEAEREHEYDAEMPALFARLYCAGLETRHRRYTIVWWGLDAHQECPVGFAQCFN